MPVVTIEGKTVTVPHEATVLEAARRVGIWIPTLCYHPSFSTLSACRICMVEVWPAGAETGQPAGGSDLHVSAGTSASPTSAAPRRTSGMPPGRLVTSCNYPIRRDLVVSVNGERPARVRRGVMQLLLARSPESAELKELAARMGVEGTPYPTVTESQRNCILCGLCVAVCEQVIGASAIGFAGRGVERAVAAPFRQPSETCIACGACAAVCPVGTIQVRIHADTGEAEISPFKSRSKLLVCEGCGERMVSVPLASQITGRLKEKIDWDEFRRLARLCPECRRKQAVRALVVGAAEADAK